MINEVTSFDIEISSEFFVPQFYTSFMNTHCFNVEQRNLN